MAFDPALPANSTKLRLAPGVIQDNWVAIQEGLSSFKPYAINLDNRTPLAVANDPAAIAESYIIYSKDDTSGDPQLYGIDPASNIIQFTKIVVGSTGTTYSANLPSGIQFRMGQVAHNGTSTAVAFESAFTTIAYSVVLTPIGSAALVTAWNAQALTTSGFTLASTTSGLARLWQYFAIGT